MIVSNVPNTDKLLSVVIPMFNEEQVVTVFLQRLANVLNTLPIKYEVVIVDDGSTDNTALLVSGNKFLNVSLIQLTNNQGHSSAIWQGLNFASGKLLMVMDGDLQHPPELIPEFLNQLHEKNSQVVFAIRKNLEKESLLKRLSSHVFQFTAGKLFGIKLIPYANDFCLMDRSLFTELRTTSNYIPILRAHLPAIAKRVSTFNFELEKRTLGHSKFTLSKMTKLFLDVVSYAKFRRLLLVSISSLIFIALTFLLLRFSNKFILLALTFPMLINFSICIYAFRQRRSISIHGKNFEH